MAAPARAPDAPPPLRGWLNELVLVPGLAVLLWIPFALLVILLGRVSPHLSYEAPLGASVLLVSLLGAYAFAVYRVRGTHRRIHGRYP